MQVEELITCQTLYEFVILVLKVGLGLRMVQLELHRVFANLAPFQMFSMPRLSCLQCNRIPGLSLVRVSIERRISFCLME